MKDGWVGAITADEVRQAWRGQVRPIAADLIPPGATPATRHFLTEVGLPTTGVLAVRFAHDERLLGTVRRDGEEYFFITAESSSIPLAVHVLSGHVFEFYPDSLEYTRFFNSDVAALVLFLGLLQRDALGLTGVSADVLERAIEDIRGSLTALDPAAMEGNAPWKQLLDDLESQIE